MHRELGRIERVERKTPRPQPPCQVDDAPLDVVVVGHGTRGDGAVPMLGPHTVWDLRMPIDRRLWHPKMRPHVDRALMLATCDHCREVLLAREVAAQIPGGPRQRE